ncbi:MAG: tetratricopeptide repeat protein [Anaerolineales bacterium]
MEQSFGNWVKRRRKALDLTQQELARQVGCSLASIVKIESDERRPSRQIADLLAKYLEISPEQRELFLKVARREKAFDGLDVISIPPTPKPVPVSKPIPSQLPNPITSFVGREHELRAILQQLQNPTCRLLTLLGPGGVGKTRLSLEVARELQKDFQHGSAFVSLAGTSSTEFIVPAIANALNYEFSGATELKIQLFHTLREKHILLVLDNLEHLLDGIQLLDDLLENAPHIKIVATSREQLNLRAEWVFEVQGLPVPEDTGLSTLESNSAAMLFMQRARQSKANFTPTAENTPAITKICRLVNGLPLGLELAATWVRMMPVTEIAREIERSMDFLSTTARDVPARHRSIRAVFDYSWELLTKEEQRILRQLAVFNGGFTREAAERVAGATLFHLSALLDKSLLRHPSTQRDWYDFHELIRQYVGVKAQSDPEEHDQMHERHANYYADWLHQWDDQLQSPNQHEVLDRISQDMDNVRAAWQWMVEHQQIDNLKKSLASMFVLHDIRNWLYQGMDIFEQAILPLKHYETTYPKESPEATMLGELMAAQGHMCWHLGQTQVARDLLQRSLRLLDRYRKNPVLSEAVLYLSLLEHTQGNYGEARWLAEECVSLNRGQNRKSGIGYALSHLGMICLSLGEYETAYEHIKEGVDVMRSIHHPRGTAINLTRLGAVAIQLGQWEEARTSLEAAVQTTRRLNDRWGVGSALNYLGWLELAQGNLDRAETLIRESMDFFEEDGDQVMVATNLTALGFILIARNDEESAQRSLLQSLRIASQCQAEPAALSALTGIATLQAKRGKIRSALELALHIRQHRATPWQFKEQAEQLWSQMEVQCTPQELESIRMHIPNKALDVLIQNTLTALT